MSIFSWKMNIFSWKVSPEDFKNQVENYRTLKITQSYRGVSALLILASAILTAGFAVPLNSGFALPKVGSPEAIDVYIYLPLAFFVYRGHMWAIIVTIVLWTFERGFNLYIGQNFLHVIWWFIFMNYFVNALRIERARRKLEPKVGPAA